MRTIHPSGRAIHIEGARHHNLKNLTLDIPRDRLVVVCGPSGSGKSTLAFDTIYAEGQRRYVESLSAYARQFLERMDKPDVDAIEGLSPAIAIEQKTTSKNPRSTVATVTEIYDYLRLLFARAGTPHCPQCGRAIRARSPQEIVDQLTGLAEGARLTLLAPVVTQRKGEHKQIFARLAKDGFVRARVDGELIELADPPELEKNKKHTIEVVIDRIKVKEGVARRLTDSVELGLRLGEGAILTWLHGADGEPDREELFSERLACDVCGVSLPELNPQMFSFNSPQGACPTCDGLGVKTFFDPDLVVPDPRLSLKAGALKPWESTDSAYFRQTLDALAKHLKFDAYKPWRDLPEETRHALLYGTEDEVDFYLERENRRHYFRRPWEGFISQLERRYRETTSPGMREEYERYMNSQPCPDCGGARLGLGLGYHQRRLVAHETHHIRARLVRAGAAQHGLIFDLQAVFVHRDICGGEHGDHARRSLGRRGVQREDTRVRPAGESRRHVQHVRVDDVAGVEGLAGDLARRINARGVGADGVCHVNHPLDNTIADDVASRNSLKYKTERSTNVIVP
jgi:excinuclease ABC subunit A